jgi:hypothetical protein
VLHGQCLRSNAGLFYQGFNEFFETLRTLDGTPDLAAALGQNGRQYFQRHYSWPVIERKYTDMLDRLSRDRTATAMEPLPGWWAQRRRVLEAADTVVARLPKGAAEELPIDKSGDRATVDDRRSAMGDSGQQPAIGDSGRRSPKSPNRESSNRQSPNRQQSADRQPAIGNAAGRPPRRPFRGRRRTPGGR